MRAHVLIPALTLAAALSTTPLGQGAPRMGVGDNPSLSGAPLYVALEKGYYREAGIDVQLEMSGTSSDMEGRIIPQVILRLRGPGWGVGTNSAPIPRWYPRMWALGAIMRKSLIVRPAI